VITALSSKSLIIAGVALYHLDQFHAADLVASLASQMAAEKTPYEPYVLSRFQELLRLTSGQEHDVQMEDVVRIIKDAAARQPA
jgi:hypothetical protein